MRCPALPSQNCGLVRCARLFNCLMACRTMAAFDVPARTLVPSEIVTGRSVLFRRVTQGMPNIVVSS